MRKKPLKINFKTTNYSGSKLLGYERSDIANSINLSLPLTKSLVLIAGATETNSSIGCYDSLTPVFGLQYNPS